MPSKAKFKPPKAKSKPSKTKPKPGPSHLAPPPGGASEANADCYNKRRRTNDRGARLAQAEAAKKKRKKEEEIQSRKPAVCDFSFVYVGNLKSTITLSLLESFFKDCGQIKRTVIRCSRGQAVMAGVAVPQEILGPRDRQYASIEFMNPESARKALAYHGMILDGCQLVVSTSPADLPEAQDIIESRIASMRMKQLGPMPPRKEPQRPIATHATEAFSDFSDPSTDRHHVLGFSFGKGIM